MIQRGEMDRPAIAVPTDLQSLQKDAAARRPPSSSFGCLAVRSMNITEDPMIVFIQKMTSSIDDVALEAGRSTIRFATVITLCPFPPVCSILQ